MAASNCESSTANKTEGSINFEIVIRNLNTDLELILQDIETSSHGTVLVIPILQKCILTVTENFNYYNLVLNNYPKERSGKIMNYKMPDNLNLTFRELFSIFDMYDVEKARSFVESLCEIHTVNLFISIMLQLIESKFITSENIRLLNRLGAEFGDPYMFGYVSSDSDDEDNGWYTTRNFFKMSYQLRKKRKILKAPSVPPQEDVDGLDESLWKEFVAIHLNDALRNVSAPARTYTLGYGRVSHSNSSDNQGTEREWQQRQAIIRRLVNIRIRGNNLVTDSSNVRNNTRRNRGRGRTNSGNAIVNHTGRDNNRSNRATNNAGSAYDDSSDNSDY